MHPPFVTTCLSRGRPQPMTSLDFYIKDEKAKFEINYEPKQLHTLSAADTQRLLQRYKDNFDKLSAVDKHQYEKRALSSLRQYQKVLCFTLSAPSCTFATFLMHRPCSAPRLSASLSVVCLTLHALCLTLHNPLHSRLLRAVCTLGVCPYVEDRAAKEITGDGYEEGKGGGRGDLSPGKGGAYREGRAGGRGAPRPLTQPHAPMRSVPRGKTSPHR